MSPYYTSEFNQKTEKKIVIILPAVKKKNKREKFVSDRSMESEMFLSQILKIGSAKAHTECIRYLSHYNKLLCTIIIITNVNNRLELERAIILVD